MGSRWSTRPVFLIYAASAVEFVLIAIAVLAEVDERDDIPDFLTVHKFVLRNSENYY
jgi:hypothetical protein